MPTSSATVSLPLASGKLTDGILFVCVRRLVERTGVELLIKAFDRALREARIPPTTTLLIAGSGPRGDAVRKLIADLGRSDNVRLLGFISDAMRDVLYQRAYYNIVPSVALEGFGLVVIEAAIFGCPSIVTNIGALPEVIDLLDRVGLVCEPEVASLARAMENAVRLGPIDRQQLRQKVLKRFTFAGLLRSPPQLSYQLSRISPDDAGISRLY
jgi:glycosyltransferase involved in cell wall biosynthesis